MQSQQHLNADRLPTPFEMLLMAAAARLECLYTLTSTVIKMKETRACLRIRPGGLVNG